MRLSTRLRMVSLLPAALVALASAACGSKPPTSVFPWPLEAGRGDPAVHGLAVKTLNPGYDRRESKVLVRIIENPTRANLDFAAYHANVMIRDQTPQEVREGVVPPHEELFKGLLVTESIASSIIQTPLTEGERARPIMFSPVVDFLSRWNYEKASPLEDVRNAVRAEDWGTAAGIGTSYQQITVAYLHDTGRGKEMWVEIEFQSGVGLFDGMPDEDDDGFAEIYAKIDDENLPAEVVGYITGEYLSRPLDGREIRDWANQLASYWYPSYNTDIFDVGTLETWPTDQTEPAVRAELGDFRIHDPAIIMVGKPHGEPIYNVFVIPGVDMGTGLKTAEAAQVETRGGDSVTPRTEALLEELGAELEASGYESYEAWAKALAPVHEQIEKMLRRSPRKIKALEGRGGFLFYRSSLDYVTGGDLRAQPPGKDPFDTIVAFKDYLASLGVDFLLVPIPTKSEVFPDKVVKIEGEDQLPILNPYGRKFFAELGRAGVEVIDLLPMYLKARSNEEDGQEPLYISSDTHWTDKGLRMAAARLAKRIRSYPWFEETFGEPVAYETEEVTFTHEGDLVSRLPARRQKKYIPLKLRGTQVVLPGGTLYDDDPSSRVLVLGDSFTGVYQRTFCNGAGVSAHLAKELSGPVDLVMSYGGGPNVRGKLMRRGEGALSKKKLVIWMFAARDLYDYYEDWRRLERPTETSGN